MQACFVHDHVFLKYKGKYYSNGKLTYNQLKEYLEYCTSLVVIGRYKEVDYFPGDMFLSEGDNVKIVGFDGLLSKKGILRRRSIKSEVYFILKESDYIISRMPSEFGILACDFARINNIKCLVEMVASPFDCLWYRGDFFAKIYSFILRHRVRNSIYNATHVIYVTNDYLQSEYPTKGKQIGISDARVFRVSENKQLRKNNIFRVGIIANPALKLKGVETLYTAFKMLNGFEYKLSIVGGTGNSPVERVMKEDERVELLGVISDREELSLWFESLDLYVQTSLTEGLPRSIVEAMSHGIPVIASNVGGIPEIVSPSYLFEPTDVKSLVRLIERIANVPESYHQSSLHSCNTASKFTDNLDKVKSIFIKDFVEY
ncbi:glycosyltransferase family 4 protein [Vibrio parahaemolyticus]|nr:glycosyltransferase family 4 protein [Vibrio parahaemolyticus]